jgi:membrane dipeptidase
LILSHTALSDRPYPWTRLITSDHARAIASVRGVIGIWPVAEVANVSSYAANIARMVDVVGVDHVGIGTDQLGLTGASCMPSYADLPQLAAALSSRFKQDEINKLLGGNYRRVFETCIA